LKNARPESLTIGYQSLAETLIRGGWFNPFPKIRTTERPDTASAQLLEGSVIVICDTSPQAMILPTSIFDYLEETDDFCFPPLTGSYLRLVRAGILLLSVVVSLGLGNGSQLAAAIPKGAQAGLELAISLAGSICLWCGVGKLMEKAGITELLCKIFSPLLGRIFPSYRKDRILAGHLSSNVCANFLGLGNAATPMGILAAKRFADGCTVATDELCRLIVLNTASIQLIPVNVAAIRAQLDSNAPFDILPTVWITSITSAGMGLLAAWGLGKLWKHA
jgi:spore maturation protein A